MYVVDLSERRRDRLGAGGFGWDVCVILSAEEGSLPVLLSGVFVVVGEDVDPMR